MLTFLLTVTSIQSFPAYYAFQFIIVTPPFFTLSRFLSCPSDHILPPPCFDHEPHYHTHLSYYHRQNHLQARHSYYSLSPSFIHFHFHSCLYILLSTLRVFLPYERTSWLILFCFSSSLTLYSTPPFIFSSFLTSLTFMPPTLSSFFIFPAHSFPLSCRVFFHFYSYYSFLSSSLLPDPPSLLSPSPPSSISPHGDSCGPSLSQSFPSPVFFPLPPFFPFALSFRFFCFYSRLSLFVLEVCLLCF